MESPTDTENGMLYSILIYDSEAVVDALTEDEQAARIRRHQALQQSLQRQGKLGPVARLMPSTAAVTLRPAAPGSVVLDGPFAETKEHLVGFYVLDCDSLEEAIEAARALPLDTGALEVRPIGWFEPGGLAPGT